MLKLGLKTTLEGPLERLRKMAAHAQDLQPLYKRWGGYLRKEAKDRIESGQGFSPLAESTQKRLQHTRKSAITTQGNVRQSYAKRLAVQLNRQVKRDKLDEGVLDDLKDLVRGGRQALTMDLSDRRAKALVRLQQQLKQAQAGQRVGGNRRQSEHHHILGKLGNSLKAQGTKTEAIAESRIPWSQVHNEGGTVGHGAQVPARPFLLLTAESKRTLAQMAVQYLTGEDE